MQANAGQTSRAHGDGAPVHYERQRPEQSTLYRLLRQHAQSFFAQTEETTGASLPQFVKDEFEAFLARGILAHGFLRLLLAAQPVLVTPALQVVHRVITCHLLEQTGFKVDEAASGAVALIQRFGSAANLNIHLHCLVLDGVYRRTEGEPVFVEVPAPTDEQLQALLHKIIAAIMEAAGTRADPPAAGPASAPAAPGAGARRSSKGGVVRRAAGRGRA